MPKEQETQEKALYVKGGKKEDNQRYKEFLKYCEERRTVSRREEEQDVERKQRADKKTRHWELLRVSIEFLKKNEQKWKTRSLKECTRIRELEKEERLAIVKEKRKRYGIKTLSKEESRRLKARTEERIEIAQAKDNYWKWYREGGREERKGEKEDIRDAWTLGLGEILNLHLEFLLTFIWK